jgi:hypothetical protein
MTNQKRSIPFENERQQRPSLTSRLGHTRVVELSRYFSYDLANLHELSGTNLTSQLNTNRQLSTKTFFVPFAFLWLQSLWLEPTRDSIFLLNIRTSLVPPVTQDPRG